MLFLLRDVIFIIDEKINGKSNEITKKDIWILAFLYGISIISIIVTFKGVLTLLYVVGSMLYTYSIWQKNNKVYRFLGIVVTVLVICDSIYIKSIFGIILQSVVLVTSIIGYISAKREETKSTTNTTNTKIYALNS